MKPNDPAPRFTKRDYEAYIASPAWAAKRERALNTHGRRCEACGDTSPGLHVHHHTYERFKRERMEDLIILCAGCHRVVHRMHRAQRRLTLTEVTFAFLRHKEPKAYSAVVLADHTPPVPPAPERTDGKKAVSLAKADRKRSNSDAKGMTSSARKARAQRYREMKQRLG